MVNAHASDATVMIARQIIIRRTLPIMSETGPRIGCISAKGSAKAVVNSATVPGSTARPSAIGGTIGSTARVDSADANPIMLTWVRKRVGDGGAPAGGMGLRSLVGANIPYSGTLSPSHAPPTQPNVPQGAAHRPFRCRHSRQAQR